MRVAFFGTPQFAVPTLRALLESRHDVVLVVAQPDRPVGRGMQMTRPPVAALALEAGIPIEQPVRIDDAFVSRIGESGAEIAVVVAYGKILPRRLLDGVPGGFLNVHASLLPRWRGAAPVQRSIAAGERVTGVTIMRIDEELDHGPTLAMREIAIGEHDRAPAVFARLAEAGGSLLIDVLDQVERGDANEVPQQHERATLAPKIRKEEGEVDWGEPARALYDRFRAFDPWPGLAALIRGEKIKLTDLGGVSDDSGAPGQVLAFLEGAAVVATGEDALIVRSIQRPGKRAADAADVLRGMKIAPGDVLQ